ncbi:NAD(P)H-hydrate dehydratase [Candidatus Woesearchaeota archaeon]|nr:NAD(P)H-hydrate dehydratase [Candidatus Woesearchaeota archaeon]
MRIPRYEHKGKNGKVLVVGGSRDYTGAVILSGIAALRTGVDIVTVCAPEDVAWAINSYSPDLITKKFIGNCLDITHANEIISLSENYDSILIGNGLGIQKDFVNKIIRSVDKIKVIDADALKVVNISLLKDTIFTPHVKEFEVLFNNSLPGVEFRSREHNINEIQRILNNNVMLLKGRVDMIFNNEKIHKNKTGNNSMTIGGTGDILAGLCAGFAAQTKDLFWSAKKAAYVNGKTGEHLSKHRGNTYLASDMLEDLWRFIK